MGRVEQRLYRQQMARRRLGRMIVLMLLIFAAGALTISRNAASHLTAETIAQPTATPIAAAYDQTVVSREITLAAETWYAIQTGVFSKRGCRAGESGTAHRPRRTGRGCRGRRKVARVHCLLRHGDGCCIRAAAAGRKSAHWGWSPSPDMSGIAASPEGNGRSGGCCRGGVHAAAASRADAAGHRVPAGCGRTDADGSAGADNSAGRSDDAMAADGAGALRAQSAVADQGAAGAVGRVGADQGQSGESGQQNSPVRPVETGGNRAVRADDCASAGGWAQSAPLADDTRHVLAKHDGADGGSHALRIVR